MRTKCFDCGTDVMSKLWVVRPIEDALRAENERMRKALEKIADYPPGHWRIDNPSFARAIDIAREALKGDK